MADNAARTEQDYRPLRAAPLPVPSGTGRVLTAVTDSTSQSGYRLIWDNGLAAVGALTALTNSTGVTPDNTVGAVPDAEAAVTDTTAASLTSVNTSLAAVEDSLADLAGKINEIIAAAAI